METITGEAAAGEPGPLAPRGVPTIGDAQRAGSKCACAAPEKLSGVTTIKPSAGVCAHSVGSMETGTEAAPPAATSANMPWLIELDQALNFADPAIASVSVPYSSSLAAV